MLPVLPNSKKHSSLSAHRAAHLVDNNNASQRSVGGSSNKRTHSMIFRIEHLLPTATVPHSASGIGQAATDAPVAPTSSNAELREPKRSKLATTRSGVYVSQFTPKDTYSEPLTTHALLSVPLSVQLQPTRAYCSLTTTTEGASTRPSRSVLCMTPANLRKVKLSEDIPSYNALFELHSGMVRLRTVRDIPRDDEIVAWFGEDATLLMAIPFLTPLNIQGNNRYTCHLCHLTFETPNPLKIHLALGCGRHSIDILWLRLHYALQQAHNTLPPTAPVSAPNTIQLSPVVPSTSTASISPAVSPVVRVVSTPSPPDTSSLLQPRFSAFKPIATSSILAPLQRPNVSVPVSVPSSPSVTVSSHSSLSMLPSFSAMSLPAMSLLPNSPSANPLNAAAQIEAIVSNMGASKQGHLCIYCGKVYSRKYGLKIHIRTHTGFKPLKCKYCLRPFGDPSNLNKHVRLHLQSSAVGAASAEGYKCALCHKTLARRRDLQRHMESRHSTSSAHTQQLRELPEKGP